MKSVKKLIAGALSLAMMFNSDMVLRADEGSNDLGTDETPTGEVAENVESSASAETEQAAVEVPAESAQPEVTVSAESTPDAEGESTAVPVESANAEETASVEPEVVETQPAETPTTTPEESVSAALINRFSTAGADGDVISASIDGQGLPEGTQLVASLVTGDAYNSAIDAVAQMKNTDSSKLEGRLYDIYFLENGVETQPDENVHVTIAFANAVEPDSSENTEVTDTSVVHVHDGNAEDITSSSNVATNNEGEVQSVNLTTDSFSVFGVVYTVDYTYGNYNWSMAGSTSILLSTLFANVGINANAADAVSVEFTNYDLLSVTQIDGDFQLTSLKPFDTSETLTVTMRDGTKYVIGVTDNNQVTDNLSNVLTGAKISGVQPGEDGTYSLKANTEYTFQLQFNESSSDYQFADTLTMKLPDGLMLEGQDGTLYIAINTSSAAATVPAHYTVNKDGTLTVAIDTNDPHYGEYAKADNAEFSVSFQGKVKEGTGDLPWNSNVHTKVDVDSKTDLSITKQGQYNPKDNKVHYTLTIVSTGYNKNVVVTDGITGTALMYDANSLSASSTNPQLDANSIGTVSENTSNRNGFIYTIGQMTDGQTVTLAYTASVDTSKITGDGTVEQTENGVKIKSDTTPEEEKNQNVEHQINWDSISKTAGAAGVSGNTATVPWTITVNENAQGSVEGTTVKDTITSSNNGSKNMSYSGPVTYTYFNKDGTQAGTGTAAVTYYDATGNVTTDQAQAKSWQYTLTEKGNYKYVFSYNTTVDLTNAVKDVTVTNNSEDGKGHSSQGTSTIKDEKNQIDVRKRATEVTTQSITWQVDIDVPAKGLNSAVVEDTYPTTSFTDNNGVWRSGVTERLLENSNITVTGLNSGENYSIDTTSSNQHFTITFTKSDGKPGLDASTNNEKRTVSVIFTTKNDPDWVAKGTAHTNTVEYTGNGESVTTTADATPTSTSKKISKKIEASDKVTINGVEHPIYKVSLSIEGYDGTEDLVITDKYNTDYLTYKTINDDGYNIWHMQQNITIGGATNSGDYWDYFGGKTGVGSGENTQDGVTLTIPKDVVPRDGTGHLYKVYNIQYYLVANDISKLQQDAVSKGGSVAIQDIATFGDASDDASVNYAYDYLKKSAGNYDQSKNEITYTLTINPGAFQLNGGNNFPVKDESSENLTVDYSSITVNPENAGVRMDSKGHVITFDVPDGKAITITYKAHANQTGSQNLSNEASALGHTVSTQQNVEVKNAGNGSASTVWIKILKYESGDMTNRLSGAKFELYLADGTPVKDKNGNTVTITTGEDGEATIEGNMAEYGWVLKKDTPYMIKEIQAPDGYALLDHPYYFTIGDIAKYDSGSYVYINGDVMTVKNVKSISVTVTKNWGDTADHSKDSVTIMLQKSTDGRKTWNDTTYTAELNAGNNWQAIFNVPKTEEVDGQDVEVQYRPVETKGKDGYHSEVSGDMTSGFTVTNYKKGSITVTKNVTLNSKPTNTTAVDGTYYFGLFKIDGDHETYTGTTKQIVISHGVSNSVTFDELDPGTYVVKEMKDATGSDTYETQNRIAVVGSVASANITVTNNTENPVSFTNNKESASLKITKTISPDTLVLTDDQKKAIKFTVAGNDENTKEYSTSFTYADIASTGEKVLENLIPGSYKITETGADGNAFKEYTVAVSTTGITQNGGTITLQPGASGEVSFTNTYTKKTGSVTITAKKNVVNGTLAAEQFTFNLKDSNGNVAASGQNDASGNISIGPVPYDTVGTYTYTLEESGSGSSSNGWQYTSRKYKVTVKVEAKTDESSLVTSYTVTDENGDPVNNDSVSFTNTYTSNGIAQIQILKSLTNGTLKDDQFEFKLERQTGTDTWATVATAKNKADGTVTFPVQSYTQSDVPYEQTKTFNYRVSEMIPAEAKDNTKNGITYATTPVNVTVSATDDAEGTIRTTVTYPGGDDASNATITNEYHATGNAILKVKKIYNGGNDTFSFTLKDNTGNTIETKTVTGSGEASFTQLNYSQADLARSPITYTITEDVPANSGSITYDSHTETVTVTLKDNGDGTITATPVYSGGGSAAVFTNTKHESGHLALQVNKILTGRELKDGEFSFQLIDSTGKVLQTKENNGSVVLFDDIEYTAAGTYNYTIKEVIPEDGEKKKDVAYDTHNVTATVNVTEVNGVLTPTVTYSTDNGGTTFTNTYTSSSEPVSLKATKQLTGKTLANGMFTFKLLDSQGNQLQTATNKADGTVTFEPISYNQTIFAAGETEKDIVYTIQEVEPEGTTDHKKDGVTYDGHSETVTVHLKDNLDGTITATPQYDSDGAVFKNTYSTTPTSAKLSATKTITYKDGNKATEAGKYQFSIRSESSTVNGYTYYATATNNDDGSINFADIQFDKPGTYTYLIAEVEGNEPGILYDSSAYRATIEVSDSGSGELTAGDWALKKITYTKTTSGTTATESDVNNITFNNTYYAEGTADLSVTKQLSGKELKDGMFEFELKDNSTNQVIQSKKNKGGTVTFDPIKYVRSATQDDVAIATHTYTISEKIPEGAADNSNGTWTKDGITYDGHSVTATVALIDTGTGVINTKVSYSTDGGTVFTNSYKTNPIEDTLTASKTYTDLSTNSARPMTDGEFTFTLTPAATNPSWDVNKAQNLTNKANGAISIQKLVFNAPGTYSYNVQETTTDGNGVTVDKAIYVVTYTVTDNNKGALKLNRSITRNGAEVSNIVFNNSYLADGTTAQVRATKILTGKTLKEGQFSFELRKSGDNVNDKNPSVLTATNDAGGNIVFDALSYTKAGTYTYTMKETTAASADMQVDDSVYDVIVTVSDADAGKLSAAVAYQKHDGANLEGDAVPQFVNTFVSGSLKITKKVESYANITRSFTINIHVTGPDGKGLNGTFGSVTLKDGEGSVSLKNGKDAILNDLPAGSKWTVSEDSIPEGFALTTDASALTGTITANIESQATLTNKDTTTGDLKISKIVNGNAAKESDQFQVKVSLYKDKEHKQAIENGTYGGRTFKDGSTTITINGNETVALMGLPNGLYYTVEETDWKDYDTHTIANGSGQISNKNTGDKAEIVTVTNTKNRYGGFSVKKNVTGNAGDLITDFNVTVELSDKNITGTYGDMTFNAGAAKFTLQKGQTVRAYGLPNGLGYTVTEDDYRGSGYTTTYTGQIGNVVGTQAEVKECSANNISETNAVTITNNRNANGGLSITKTVTGNKRLFDSNTSFNVKITLDPLTTDTSKVQGAVFHEGIANVEIHDGETVNITGLPNGTKYKVEETDADGYTTAYAVNGVVGKQDGVITETGTSDVEITNDIEGYGGIKIQKKTAGNDKDKKTWFAFKVSLSDKTITGNFGAVQFVNGESTGPVDTQGDVDYANGKVPDGFFKIKTNETAVITGLPAGITYTITEDDYSRTYDSVSVETNGATTSGVSVSGTVAKVSDKPDGVNADNISAENFSTYTNTRDRFGKLVIKKNAVGNVDDTRKLYTFNIHIDGVNGDYDGVSFSNGDAKIQLRAGKQKTITGLPLGATFTVTEELSQEDKDNGYLDPEYQVSYRELTGYTENGDQIKETKTENGNSGVISIDQRTVTVTNVVHKVPISLQVVKKVDGNGAKPETYRFELTGENGAPMPKNAADGKASATVIVAGGESAAAVFGEITYKKEGTYTYKIKETAGNTQGMTYSTEVVTATVTVKEENDRKLSASVAYSGGTGEEGNTITNTYKTGDLVVRKSITGTTDRSKDFTFEVTVTPAVTGTYGSMVFDNGKATVTIKGDQTARANGLPAGSTYTVSEINVPDGYAEQSRTGASGTISAGSIATAVVTNKYTTGTTSVTIPVKKVVNGTDPADAKPVFTFHLVETTEGVEKPLNLDATVSGSGITHFESITYNKAGTYTYEVREEAGSATGYTYDSARHEVTVTVKDNGDGTLSNSVKIDGKDVTLSDSVDAFVGVVFANTYDSGRLTVSKTVESYDAKDKSDNKSFSFKVELSDSSIKGTYGQMTFDKGVAEFTLANGQSWTADHLPADITYTVTENPDTKFETTKTGDTGTIEKDVEAKAAFTNTRKTEFTFSKYSVLTTGTTRSKNQKLTGATYELREKKLIGSELIDSWTSDGASDHDISEKLKPGKTYELVETKAPEGYEIAKPVTITVNDDRSVSVAGDGIIADAENPGQYAVVDEAKPVTHDLEVTKVVKGLADDKWPSDGFSFELSESEFDEVKAEIPEDRAKAINKDKKAVFKNIKFSKAGTYYFVIKEVIPSGADENNIKDEIQYVNTGCPVTVKVIDTNTAGLKVASVAYGNAAQLTVTNQAFGGLRVEKEVTGSGDTEKEFHFTVTLGNEDIQGDYGEMHFEKGVAHITLKSGEKKSADHLPAEITYQVVEEEADQDGYTTESNNTEGTIIAREITEVKFVNNKPESTPTPAPSVTPGPTPTPEEFHPTTSLVVRKYVTGEGGEKDKYWNFDVYVSGNISGQYGSMNFDHGHAVVTMKSGEEIGAYDLPEGTTYRVVEKEANSDGYRTTASNSEGTISSQEASIVTFVNEKGTAVIVPNTSDSFNIYKTAGTTITSLLVAIGAALILKKGM